MPSALSFFVFPKSSTPTIVRHKDAYVLNRIEDPDEFSRDVLAATHHPKITVSFHWYNANWSKERDWQTIMAVVVFKDNEALPLLEKLRTRFCVKDP